MKLHFLIYLHHGLVVVDHYSNGIEALENCDDESKLFSCEINYKKQADSIKNNLHNFDNFKKLLKQNTEEFVDDLEHLLYCIYNGDRLEIVPLIDKVDHIVETEQITDTICEIRNRIEKIGFNMTQGQFNEITGGFR